MTEIISGEYTPNELSKGSMGGTEQMALRMANTIDQELLKPFQIIHSRVRKLDPDLKKILVLHDLDSDGEVDKLSDPSFRSQFEKFVFVSNWQMQMYNLTHNVPYKDSIVIPNAIETFVPREQSNSEEIRLIYHTTPHRGLGILVPVFEKLCESYDNIHLDVFSSFGVYGWGERDQPYQELFDQIKNHHKMTYHGFQPNKTVREYLLRSHIFAYPNIYPETSCIAAIEALCAGNLMVHPNYAALPETCEHKTWMYQYNENINQHANIFYSNLAAAIENIKDKTEFNKFSYSCQSHFNQVYNWETSKEKWSMLLKELT